MNANSASRPSKPPKPNLPKRKRRGRRGRGSKAVGSHAQKPALPKGQVSVAAAYASGQRTRAPRVTTSRDSVRIVHRELVASVVGTTAFTVARAFALNPGLATSFPWLATQAQAWERYKFNSLRFEYYTRTGSSTPGSVMLVPDYDAADAAPISEQVASSYEDVTEDAPWKDICCSLRSSALHALGPTKFVRTGALPANLDIKTYDAGNLFLCTIDGTAVNWGKLWVEYDITLMTPQLNPGGSSVMSAQHIGGQTPTSASILGTQALFPGSSTLVSVSGSTITFQQAGRYSVNLLTSALIGGSVSQNTAPATTNVTLLPVMASPQVWTLGSGGTDMIQYMVVDAIAGGTIVFDNVIVTGGAADLVVSSLPLDLVF